MRFFGVLGLVALIESGYPATSGAQAVPVRGMIVDLDVGRSALVLETRTGRREVPVAANTAIRDQHGRTLMVQDLRPGDAVAVRVRRDGATDLTVATQFWAVPPED